jgi:membrane protease YdiL (CAAX protease family)
MSAEPEEMIRGVEDSASPSNPTPGDATTHEPTSPAESGEVPVALAESEFAAPDAHADDAVEGSQIGRLVLFDSVGEPEISVPPHIPHLGHLLLLAPLALLGLLCAGGLSALGVHYHLFGVVDIQDATGDIHYTLGSMAILYFATLAGAMLIFPLFWRRSFFLGVNWNVATARRLSPRLVGAAFVCFVLALLNEWLVPGPADAPIDRLFRTPGAAWLLFGFGVTLAPFFEELLFRGFLLPALCTACDWSSAFLKSVKTRGELDLSTFSIAVLGLRPLAADGAPQWSFAAMLSASILTSLPFAAMHAPQTGYSLGPFLLLICVSMILCWVRLASRSLASSVLVHASYNFMLFSFMLLGTGGFRHLDKM